MPTDNHRDNQWQLLVTELQDCQDEQHQEWGDIDDVLLSRYLAGECNQQERERVEQAGQSFPGVRECIDMAKEVLHDAPTGESFGDAASTVAPAMGEASNGSTRRSFFRRAGRAISQSGVPNWAAAACLLVAVGIGWLLLDHVNDLRTQVVALRTSSQKPSAGTPDPEVERLRDEVAGLKEELLDRNSSTPKEHVAMRPVLPQEDSKTSDRQVATAVRRHSGVFRTVPHTVTRYVSEQCVRRVPYQVARMVPAEEPDETGKRHTVFKPVYETSEREERYTVCRPVSETQMREEAVRNLPDDVSDRPPVLSEEALLLALRRQEELVHWAAADALTRIATSKMKEEARVPIVEMLQQRDDSGRAAANYILTGRIAEGFGADLSKDAVDALSDSDKVVRWAGLHYFLVVRRCFKEEEKEPTVVPPAFFESEFTARLVQQLTKIVQQEEADVVRKAAIYLLGQFGDDAKSATGDLIRIVTTCKDPQARRWAAYALGRIGPEARSTIPHLAEILAARVSDSEHKADDVVFPAVAYAFGELCARDRESPQVIEVMPVLIELLKDPNANISHWAAYALWRINEPAPSIAPVPSLDPADVRPSLDPQELSIPPAIVEPPSVEPHRPLVPIPRDDSRPRSTPGPRLSFSETHGTGKPTPKESDLGRPALPARRPISKPAPIDDGGWRPARD